MQFTRAHFMLLLAGYGLLWWALPVFFAYNPPLDTLEALDWSRQGEWGYYKTPPLAVWLLGVSTSLLGYTEAALYLPSALCVVVALFAVWRTARRLLPEGDAILAASALTALHFYNYSLGEFNNNILEIPLWALCGWALVRAVQDKKTVFWCWLGLFLGLAFYAKYATLLLALTIVAYCIFEGQWRKPGPYLAALIALALYVPHLQWIADNNFISLRYALGRSGITQQSYELGRIIVFAGTQLLVMLPLVAVLAPVYRITPNRSPEVRLMAYLAFGPLVLIFMYMLLTGGKAKDMWTAPMWNFLPLWILLALKVRRLRPAMMTLLAVNICYVVIYIGAMRLGPDATGKIRREHFDGRYLARVIQEYVPQLPPIVLSDTWLGGNLHYHLPNHPQVYTEGNPAFAPWVTQEAIDKHGMLIVWRREIPAGLRQQFPNMRYAHVIEARWHLSQGYEAFPVAIAIVPPRVAD